MLSKRRKGTKVDSVFVDKLTIEMNQTKMALYRESAKKEDEEFSVDFFAEYDISVLAQILGTFMPIIRLKKENTYLLGAETKQITTRGENCMVRVGGGYVTIQEYYNKYATKQCVSLYQMMSSQNTPYLETIISLLEKNQAPQEVIDAYCDEGENWDSVNQLFVLIATFLEEKLKAKKPGKKGKKGKKKAVVAASGSSFDGSPTPFIQDDQLDAVRGGQFSPEGGDYNEER